MINKNIIFFINSFWIFSSKGASGGDEFVFQYIENSKINFSKIYILCNIDAKKFAIKRLQGNKSIIWLITPKFFDLFPFYISYFLRTIYATIYMLINGSKFKYIYSSSDFFPDVIPTFINILIRQNSYWIQVVHHFYPRWNKRAGNIFYSFMGYYLQKISLKLIKSSHKIICVNKDLYKFFNKYYTRQEIKLVNAGIDLNKIKKIKKKFNYKKLKKKYSAVFLGRLKPSKGIFDLPKIWKNVLKFKPDAKLAIIGEGSAKDKKKLKTLIIENNLQNSVKVMGFLSYKRIIKIFYQSKAFILPSREEGFGLAILEALACDLQVVVWDLKVFRTVYKDLVLRSKCYDFNSFSKQIIKIINSSKNKNSRRLNQLKKLKTQNSLDMQVYKIDEFILKEYRIIKEHRV
jgi:glycosyltransferase involved in cell wall biosynthesis